MAFDDLSKMAFGTVHYLYRLGTLCITVGLFLFVVVIFKSSPDFGVVPIRLILAGFGVQFWDASLWKELKRAYAVAFLVAAVLPSRFFLAAYSYLK
jgi:hypothetical protein